MSTINTDGLNVNYPIPGKNNSSQGMRDNFSVIKTNLDAAGTEITDLQNKVIVKSALSGTSINNNMANTLISNALIRGFRTATYNLGNNIAGTQIVDVSKGDVQYGTITANVSLSFAGWAPSGTESNVELKLSIANANAYLTFPNSTTDANANVTIGMKQEARILENYSSNASTVTAGITYTNKVKVPTGVKELSYIVNTTDCGTTLDIHPLNRSFATTQVSTRTPTGIGLLGDVAGMICTDGANLYFCTGTFDNSTTIWKKVTLGSI